MRAADRKLSARLSYRVWIRRKSLRRQKKRSMPVSVSVGDFVIVVRMLARWVGWNDRFGAVLDEPVAQGSGIVGTVGEEAAWRAGDVEEFACSLEVMHIAGGQHQGKRSPLVVGQRVDLGRTAPTRSADGIVERPPFAPPAERCALTCILSTEAVTPPITPVEPVRAWKISLHTALTAPTIEAVINRRVGTVRRRAVSPTRARTKHVHDARNHPTIIDPMRAASTTGEQWLKRRPCPDHPASKDCSSQSSFRESLNQQSIPIARPN